MKRLLTILLLLSAAAAQAVTISANLMDSGYNTWGTRARFIPLSTPMAVGSNTVFGLPVSTAITNGAFTLQFVGGFANFDAGSGLPFVKVLYPLNDTNTYNLNDGARLAAQALMWAGSNITVTVQGGGAGVTNNQTLTGIPVGNGQAFTNLAGSNIQDGTVGTNQLSQQINTNLLYAGNTNSYGGGIFGYLAGNGSGLTNLPVMGVAAGANITATTNAAGVVTLNGIAGGGATNGIQMLNGSGTNTSLMSPTIYSPQFPYGWTGSPPGSGLNITNLVGTNMLLGVKGFGAKGDGTTDDTAACQKCIQYLQTNSGGYCYFPAGTYKVTSTLYITNNNVHLVGDGWSSVIQASGIATNILHFQMFPDPTGFPLMADVSVQNLSVQTSTVDSNGYAIYARMSMQSHFDHLWIGDWRGAGTAGAGIKGRHNMCNGIWLDGISSDYLSDMLVNCETNAVRINGVGYGTIGPEYAHLLAAQGGYIGPNVEFYGGGATNSIGLWLNGSKGECDGLWIGNCSESGFGDGFRQDGTIGLFYMTDSYFDGNTHSSVCIAYGSVNGHITISRTWLANSPYAVLVDGMLGYSDGSAEYLPASYPQINVLQLDSCTINGVAIQLGGWIQCAQITGCYRLGAVTFGRQNAVATDQNQLWSYPQALFNNNFFDAAATIPKGVTTNYDSQTLTWAPQFGNNTYENDLQGVFDTTTLSWFNLPTEGKAFRDSLVGPQQGALIYQVDNSPGLYVYTGSQWTNVSSLIGLGIAPLNGWGTNTVLLNPFVSGILSITGSVPVIAMFKDGLPEVDIEPSDSFLTINDAVNAYSFDGNGSNLVGVASTNLTGRAIHSTNANSGLVIDATRPYQLFITNATYTIAGFSGLVAGFQHVFSQTISNSSGSTLYSTNAPGAHLIGGVSTNALAIPSGKEAVRTFWIWTGIRTNETDALEQ